MKSFTLVLLAGTIAFSAYSQSVVFTNVSDILTNSHSYGNTSEMGGGVSFVDFNQDGLDDITMGTDSTEGIYFYQNDGSGGFQKMNLSGVVNVGLHKQILWADVDNDGDYDLFTGANETGNHLYLNNGQMQFTDVTEGSGLDSLHVDNNSFGSAFADFNDDGNLDLYVSNRTINGVYLPNGNLMYYGNGDGTFENVTLASNAQDPNRAPLAVCAFDYDNDGLDDIYLAQDKNYGNSMLHNLDGNVFEQTQLETGTDFVMDGMNCEVADIDNNGFLDIHVTDVYGGSLLLMNDGNGHFQNEAPARGCAMVGDFGWGGSFVDIDNDLDLDIYVSNATLSQARKNRLFINDGTGNFEIADTDYGFEGDSLRSFGNMFGDINNDGFPDAVINNYAGESTKTFGMDNYPQVDSIQVLWPSGFSEWHYNLIAGETFSFTEGETYSVNVQSSMGNSICAESESELSIVGDYASVVWNNSTEEDVLTVTESGVYSALVTNEYGIETEVSIEISVENETLNLDIVQGLAICPFDFLADVTAEIQSEIPYTIAWNDIEGTEVASLEVGEHSVTVTDENGCAITQEFEVIHTEELAFEDIVTPVSCFGGDDGQLILNLAGADPFQIEIDEQASTIFTSNMTGGIYNVEITDANGCSYAEEVEVYEPDSIIYEFITEPDFGNNEGTVSIFDITGGTAPFTVNGGSSFEFSNLAEGEYAYELCDSNECCLDFTAVVDFQIGVEELATKKISIYPNPAEDFIHIKLPENTSTESLRIINVQGKEVEIDVISFQSGLLILNVKNYASGTYSLELGDRYLRESFIIK